MAIMLRKTTKKMESLAEEVKAKAFPMISSAQTLLDDIGPKLKTATSEFSDLSQKVRHQANNLNETLDNALEKANVQIRRIDEMVSGTIDAVEHASRAIESAVAAPTRRVSGVLHGIRVGMGVFLGRERNPRVGSQGAPGPQGPVARVPVARVEEPISQVESPSARSEGPRTVEFPQQKHA